MFINVKYRICSMLGALILSVCLICSNTLTVYATSHGGGGVSRPSSTTDFTDFDKWSSSDKFNWWKDNLLSLIAGGVGCIFNPFNWNYDYYMDYFHSAALDKQVADESTDYQEYIANRIGLNDSGELVVDDELNDIMYLATETYIEEETGWDIAYSIKPEQLVNGFTNSLQYSGLKKICNSLADDEILIFKLANVYIDGNTSLYYPSFYIVKFDGFVKTGGHIWLGYYSASPYYQWQNSSEHIVKTGYIMPDGNINYIDLYSTFLGATYSFLCFDLSNTYNSSSYVYYVKGDNVPYRVYKTYDDYKAYSIGQRPYMTTSKFQDYDVNGDNSCIVTESDLSNGSVYGDVYNYVINNYDNPDSLTEDQLVNILDKYFDDLQQNTGSGGSGSSGSSGGGLGGLLSGLGSVGDAVMAILGKLLEYVGKALELLSGTVTKVIDIIPSNITALLSGLFPFIPEEWLTIIELSLVLGVILGIVGMFKK